MLLLRHKARRKRLQRGIRCNGEAFSETIKNNKTERANPSRGPAQRPCTSIIMLSANFLPYDCCTNQLNLPYDNL